MSTSVRMLAAVYAVLVAITPYKSLVSEKSGNNMDLNIARGTTDRVECFCQKKEARNKLTLSFEFDQSITNCRPFGNFLGMKGGYLETTW